MTGTAVPVGRGAVIVTGASSGIGRATADALMASGFRVISTARNTADCDMLRQAGCESIVLDISDREGVLRFRDDVLQALGDTPLAGLVNNAGTACMGPWEHVDLDEMANMVEVNVLGTAAVIQAFLGRIRADGGRIVLIGSVAGRLANPFFGAYSATRFATRAMADSLRRELSDKGVRVVLIEAGTTRTPIWQKLDTSLEVDDIYAPALNGLREHIVENSENGLAPAAVARAVKTAMTDRRPPSTLLVVRQPTFLYWLYLRLPDFVADMLLKLRQKTR